MSELRFNVVEKAFRAKPLEIAVPSERKAEYFGKYEFNSGRMLKYLPSPVYACL